ncbi:type II toxin-antitoxin system HigB family toxin [Marinoscillum sp.]|uniref:type II toxin-antitoxin system HigB family toxin n=1 Tax=Marinoscillum sp. TaxID=2024838 RepID=UPI003BAB3942
MQVHLIKEKTILDFTEKYAGSKAAFDQWLQKLEWADWDEPGDIKSTYNSADLLGQGTNRVVFNIGGNNYRLIGQYSFGKRMAHLFVCWIGTHAEYDKICKKSEQYTISIY